MGTASEANAANTLPYLLRVAQHITHADEAVEQPQQQAFSWLVSFNKDGLLHNASDVLNEFSEKWPLVYIHILQETERLRQEIISLTQKEDQSKLEILLAKFIIAFLSQVRLAMEGQPGSRVKQVDIYISPFSDGVRAIEQLIAQAKGKKAILPFSQYPVYLNSLPNNGLASLSQPAIEIVLAHAIASSSPVMSAEWEKETREFYLSLATTLYEQANQTTANREAQLKACLSVIASLEKNGHLESDYRLADIGCGNCTFLSELLLALKQNGSAQLMPGKIFGVDLNPSMAGLDLPQEYPTPQLIQASFLSEELTNLLTEIDVALMIWSPLNDVPLERQVQALKNLHGILKDGGILVLDVPVGYEQEIMTHQRQYPEDALGTIKRSFLGADGQQHEKRFAITPLGVLIHLAELAKLRVCSELEVKEFQQGIYNYQTNQGQKRAIVVVKKMEKHNIKSLINYERI